MKKKNKESARGRMAEENKEEGEHVADGQDSGMGDEREHEEMGLTLQGRRSRRLYGSKSVSGAMYAYGWKNVRLLIAKCSARKTRLCDIFNH